MKKLIAAAALLALAAAIPVRAEAKSDQFAICSQVSRAIDHPIDLAFSHDAALEVWSNVMALAGCDSGEPDQITTKVQLEDAARLARALCRSTGHDVLDCWPAQTKTTPEPKAADQLLPSK